MLFKCTLIYVYFITWKCFIFLCVLANCQVYPISQNYSRFTHLILFISDVLIYLMILHIDPFISNIQ